MDMKLSRFAAAATPDPVAGRPNERTPKTAALQRRLAAPSAGHSTSHTSVERKISMNGKRIGRFALFLGATLFTGHALADGPLQFYSVTPCRIVDTRRVEGATGGPALASGSPRNFPVMGATCGVPLTAKAATLNVTMIAPTKTGFLTIWPYNMTKPVVSTINALAGEPAIANGAIVPLASDPSLNISVVYGTCGLACAGSANLVIDVTGYFQ